MLFLSIGSFFAQQKIKNSLIIEINGFSPEGGQTKI
jgi:hypothetical protein